jgi:XTP/dITP diphosphohydrolase
MRAIAMLEKMVRFKVESAYRAVLVPCIVEHAGLVLEGYETASFPGGLTQPMWDAGYCDGMNIDTFVGETKGTLSPTPRGNRAFWR